MSVLAVVAASPTRAANTAQESLIDHDSNVNTPQVRRFAGTNRYATSLAIAEDFAAARGSLDTIVVASGEALTDAAVAVGLAAAKSAPVVLTTPNRVSRALENLIDNEFVAEVLIVGGTSSVSASVADQFEDLNTVSSVERFSGSDRYETSAEVAREVGEPGLYCDTGQAAALLVNVDSSLADVVAVGPLAYSLSLPILYTSADELPASVSSYITDAEVERIIIIGGTGAVSAAVESQALDAGAVATTRIAGVNRFDTAVKILEAIRGCATRPLSPTTVALINGNSPADGISAGPLLAQGRNNDGVTPALLISSTSLPSETSTYLSSTPRLALDGTYTHLFITAIGGTTAIPPSVMTAAIGAATNSPTITATAKPLPGSNAVTITFSSLVNRTPQPNTLVGVRSLAWRTSALNPAHYRVGGEPLFDGDTLAVGATDTQVVLDLAGDEALTVGNAIQLLGGRISGLLGTSTGNDNRRVQGATFSVDALPPDTRAPVLSITAAQGDDEFAINIEEANDKPGEVIELSDITLRGAALPSTAALYFQGSTAAETRMSEQIIVCLWGLTDYEYYYQADGNGAGNQANPNPDFRHLGIEDEMPAANRFVGSFEACEDTPPDPLPDNGARLVSGDQITVAAEAIVDLRDNTNRAITRRVSRARANPRPLRATVSRPVNAKNDAGNEILATGSTPADANAPARWEGSFTVTAKADGAAAGIAGNTWSVEFIDRGVDVSPETAAADADNTPEVEILVVEERSRVVVLFDDNARVSSIAQAMTDNVAFSSLFEVTNSVAAVGTTTEASLASLALAGGAGTNQTISLSGGAASVTLRIVFDDILESFHFRSHTNPGGLAAPSDAQGAITTSLEAANEVLQAEELTTQASLVNGIVRYIRTQFTVDGTVETRFAGTSADGAMIEPGHHVTTFAYLVCPPEAWQPATASRPAQHDSSMCTYDTRFINPTNEIEIKLVYRGTSGRNFLTTSHSLVFPAGIARNSLGGTNEAVTLRLRAG